MKVNPPDPTYEFKSPDFNQPRRQGGRGMGGLVPPLNFQKTGNSFNFMQKMKNFWLVPPQNAEILVPLASGLILTNTLTLLLLLLSNVMSHAKPHRFCGSKLGVMTHS